MSLVDPSYSVLRHGPLRTIGGTAQWDDPGRRGAARSANASPIMTTRPGSEYPVDASRGSRLAAQGFAGARRLPGTVPAVRGHALQRDRLDHRGEMRERLEGRPASVAALADGKPTVLNLWATGWPPCRREMPVLAAAQRAEPAAAFVFANQGEAEDAIRGYLRAERLEIANVVLDPDGVLGRETRSAGLPTTLF